MKWFVYVIWARNEDGEEVRYYGHTHDMKEREDTHVRSYNSWVRAGRPDRIRDAGHGCRSVFILDMCDWKIEVLHELDCDEEETSRVEGNYIRYNKCVNFKMDGRTKAQWRHDNLDMLRAQQSEKVPCPCGELVSRSNIARHLRSQKHAKRMQQSTSSS